jgi:hypothetical protein
LSLSAKEKKGSNRNEIGEILTIFTKSPIEEYYGRV